MPDTVTRRNLSRGGASPGSEIPDSELRITAGLPFPHGPRHPARPIRENPRTARTSGLQPCDSGPNMKSARTTTACAAQRVTRARPSRSDATKPPVDGRSRSPPQGSGRCIPRRAGRTVTPRVLTLPASCGQAPAAPDIRPSTAKASANGRSAGRFPGNDSPPPHRRDRGKIAQDREEPGRSVYSSPCRAPGSVTFRTLPRDPLSAYFSSAR